jgi:SAM-dependent methyltransferase
MDASALAPLSECPTCRRAPLAPGPSAWRCGACGAEYPVTDAIPWLYRDPGPVLGEWKNRLTLYLEDFALEERLIAADFASATLAATRTRLDAFLAACREQRALIAALLAPLGLGEGPAPHATQLAVATRVPQHQDLHSYYANLHRDWVWGEAENEAARALVASAFGTLAGKRLLVLGAGAGRLCYDLAEGERPALTVALDINPLLLYALSRLARGERFALYEFPLAPVAELAVKRELRAPRAASAPLVCLFADALEAPFAAQSFDAVLTPWLVDILDEDFARLALRVSRLLAPGGRWVNFGSLSFAQRRPGLRYGRAELREVLAATGFAVAGDSETRIPYMQSPASRHARLETVYCFAADKRERAPREAPPPAPPVWASDLSAPVPLDESLKLTALATRLQAFMLALVDGERSVNDIAGFVVEQKLLPHDQAVAAVRALLLQLAEQASRTGPR